jgi:hypothetical protein
LNQIANDNKIANQAAFSKWLQTHTPEQIKDANNARQLLKRKLKKSGAKLHDVSPIADPRLPKRAGNALSYFLKDRHASGDFKGIKIGDAGKLISQEWKTLPAGERKVCSKPISCGSMTDKFFRFTRTAQMLINNATSKNSRLSTTANPALQSSPIALYHHL